MRPAHARIARLDSAGDQPSRHRLAESGRRLAERGQRRKPASPVPETSASIPPPGHDALIEAESPSFHDGITRRHFGPKQNRGAVSTPRSTSRGSSMRCPSNGSTHGSPAYGVVADLPITATLGPTEPHSTTVRVPWLLNMPGTPPSQLRFHAPPGTPSRVTSEWPAQSLL